MTVRIICADAIAGLRELPDNSVNCVVSSPPYYSLRDYQTGRWEGGDPECGHINGQLVSGKSTLRNDGREHRGPYEDEKAVSTGMPFRDLCAKCGARRIDQQIGLEESPDAWAARLVEVFREVRRVLRSDGTLWLNVGDGYAHTSAQPDRSSSSTLAEWRNGGRRDPTATSGAPARSLGNLKPKDLIGAPWLLAFALRADGWWLRSAITWCKTSAMPESVRDRPTKATEMIFMLTKSSSYYYDQDAFREPHKADSLARIQRTHHLPGHKWENGGPNGQTIADDLSAALHPGGANLRDYWLIGPEPFPDAHFAVFPSEIPRRAILLGTSATGVCPACLAPWARVVEREANGGWWEVDGSRSADAGILSGRTSRAHGADNPARAITTGWRPSCSCAAGEPVPAVCLDPFAGSGTTGLVADQLGRDAVLLELNPDYAAMAERRIAKARARRMLGDVERIAPLPGQTAFDFSNSDTAEAP